MAEYIEIDAPIDVAVYQRNRRIKVTLRQILESNDAKYERADVRPVVRGKWKHDKDGLVWCLNCGFGKERSDERAYHFCPNCGARMEGPT